MKIIEHGGNLAAVASRYGIAENRWLDLSTGISPHAYPIPALPRSAYQQLPYAHAGLNQAAQNYYFQNGKPNSHQLLAVPGSQAAIELLPTLLKNVPILLPSVGYQEHHLHWQALGQQATYRALNSTQAGTDIDQQLADHHGHLLIINPNNPSGLLFEPQQIIGWAKQLASNCYVIVDEAFIDTKPQGSLLNQQDIADNIIVLRSFGKFFGLAGLRLGFVAAQPKIIQQLQQRMLTWGISGPSQAIAAKALADTQWQQQAIIDIRRSQQLTHTILKALPLTAKALASSELFQSYKTDNRTAEALFEHCCRHGILIRKITLTDQKSILRFGLIDHQCPNDAERVLNTLHSFKLGS